MTFRGSYCPNARSPLGWFDDPPVPPCAASGPALPPNPARAAQFAHDTPQMLVIRGAGFELATSNETYTQTSRRTRLSNLTMLAPGPLVIASKHDLEVALREPADILQLSAHCGPAEVRFSDGARFGTAELAERLARLVPRLAVLIGCRSGALGRALVERGAEAVVAMRVEVYSRTIQPLVANLMSLVLSGVPIDLAFAEALRSYVLTGQPGAAAVPMLYLSAGSTGELFA